MQDRDSRPKIRAAGVSNVGSHRIQHIALLGLALVVAVLSAGSYYLQAVSPSDPLIALRGTNTPSAPAPTLTPTAPATPEPTPSRAEPTEAAIATATASPTSEDRLTVGGINLVDADSPLGLTYPRDWDGAALEVIDALQILVSDDAGENLRAFGLISQWNGVRKIFVYADILIGSPVVAMHDGYYRDQPLEAEAFRRLLEGRVGSPYPLAAIEKNLARVVGERFVFRQGEREAAFAVEKAIRMNAQVTQEYAAKPGELSALLGSISEPENAILLLICSTSQPGESDQVFPARFLVLLRHIP